MDTKQFKISAKNAGQRLDKFLTVKLPDLSRSQIQKIIKNKLIRINDQPTKVHTFLKEGDRINIEQKEGEIKTVKVKKTLPKITLDIIAEDKNFLIINKPAGIVIHPDDVYKENTLIDQVIEKYPEIKGISEDPSRPGVVHRIDKDVSGLLVVAKTQEFYEKLKQQFKLRKIKKEYTALVYGAPSPKAGIINFPIERSAKGLMVAKPEGESGKKAITEYETIKKFNHFSLLKIQIHTGRTHQIRTHMKAIGHSIVGDKLYQNRGLASPWADVDSYIPYEGRVDVKLKTACELSVRIPEWVTPQQTRCEVNGKEHSLSWEGRYAVVGKVKPKDVVTLCFPISERTDVVRIQGKQYTLIRKGNDVVHIDPQGKYCPLYQREKYRENKVHTKRKERFVANQQIQW